MPLFCLWDHEQLPICRATVEHRRRDRDKSGFRLRYVLDVADESHANDVIRVLDRAMGAATRAHGVYQAPYGDLRDAYADVLDGAPADPIHDALRPTAMVLGVALALAMIVVWTAVVPMFLFVAAVKKQSGLAAIVEASVLAHLLDWRPAVARLLNYAMKGHRE